MRLARSTKSLHPLLAGAAGLLAAAMGAGVATAGARVGMGVAAGLSVLAVSLADPTWLFTVLYPLMVPLGRVPIRIGAMTISLERALVIAAIGGTVGGILVTRRLRPERWRLPVRSGLLLWLGAYVVSLALFPSAAGATAVLGLAQKAAMSYMVFMSFRGRPAFLQALRLFLAASFVASLFTFAAYLQHDTLAFVRQGSYVVGETYNESLFQGIARAGAGNTMALWIAMFFWGRARHRAHRSGSAVLVLWLGIVSLFALRRETLVTLAAGLALMAWHQPVVRRRLLGMGGALLAAATGFVLLSPEWMDRLTHETARQLSSFTDPRIMLLLRFTPAAVMGSPWIGYGPGNYALTQLRFPETLTARIIELGGISAHNVWSAAVVEAGVVGLAGVCLFLYGIGRPLWQRRETGDEGLDSLWAFAPVIFLQLLIYMAFGFAVSLPVVWFWTGFLLALEHTTRQPYAARG